jgi:hypothetical protein
VDQWDLITEALTGGWSGAFGFDADLGQWRQPARAVSKARPSWSGYKEIPGLKAAAEQSTSLAGKSKLGLRPAFQPYWGKSRLTSKDADVTRRGFVGKLGRTAVAGLGMGLGLGAEKRAEARKSAPVRNMTFTQPKKGPSTPYNASQRWKLSGEVNEIPWSRHYPTRDEDADDAAALPSASYPKRTLGNRIGKAVRSATGRPRLFPSSQGGGNRRVSQGGGPARRSASSSKLPGAPSFTRKQGLGARIGRGARQALGRPRLFPHKG